MTSKEILNTKEDFELDGFPEESNNNNPIESEELDSENGDDLNDFKEDSLLKFSDLDKGDSWGDEENII